MKLEQLSYFLPRQRYNKHAKIPNCDSDLIKNKFWARYLINIINTKWVKKGKFKTNNTKILYVAGEKLMMTQLGNRKMYHCHKCAYSTNNSTHCVTHVQKHGSHKMYQCDFCDYSLDKLPHIMAHMKQVHPTEVTHKTNSRQVSENNTKFVKILNIEQKKTLRSRYKNVQEN